MPKLSMENKSNEKNTFCQSSEEKRYRKTHLGFPGGAVVKNPPANARDMGSSPGPGRSHMPRSS